MPRCTSRIERSGQWAWTSSLASLLEDSNELDFDKLRGILLDAYAATASEHQEANPLRSVATRWLRAISASAGAVQVPGVGMVFTGEVRGDFSSVPLCAYPGFG